jgi:anti-sigma factor RsiW
MNCRRFQKQVYEYVDGTLPARERIEAERHLARCDACQQVVRRERQVAQLISQRLRHEAEFLALRPNLWRRVQTAVGTTPNPLRTWESIAGFCNRFAWPLATAISLLLILSIALLHSSSGAKVCEMAAAQSNDTANQAAISIQVSYRVALRKHREDGNFVVDTIDYETVAADETLWNGRRASLSEN